MSAGVIAAHYVDAGGGGGGGPTRLYFASGGTAAVTPSFDSAWDVTTSASQRPLLLLSELGTGIDATDTTNAETSTSVINRLKRQHVSSSQVVTAHTITGTMSVVIGAAESNVAADDFLQVVAYVTDSTGSTVRGRLYSGQVGSSVSSTAGDPNEEFATGSYLTRILTVTVTGVAASVGDRVVVEIGYRACNTVSTSYNATFRLNDRAAATGDLSYTSGTNAVTAALRPWVEFSDGIFV